MKLQTKGLPKQRGLCDSVGHMPVTLAMSPLCPCLAQAHRPPQCSLPALPQPWAMVAGGARHAVAGVKFPEFGGDSPALKCAIPLSSHDVSLGEGGWKAVMRVTALVPTNKPFKQEGSAMAPLPLFLEELEAGTGTGQEHPEALSGESGLG